MKPNLIASGVSGVIIPVMVPDLVFKQQPTVAETSMAVTGDVAIEPDKLVKVIHAMAKKELSPGMFPGIIEPALDAFQTDKIILNFKFPFFRNGRTPKTIDNYRASYSVQYCRGIKSEFTGLCGVGTLKSWKGLEFMTPTFTVSILMEMTGALGGVFYEEISDMMLRSTTQSMEETRENLLGELRDFQGASDFTVWISGREMVEQYLIATTKESLSNGCSSSF